MNRLFTLILVLSVISALIAGCPKPEAKGPGVAAPVAPAGAAKAAPGGQTQITVFVPCGMIIPFKTVMSAYEQAHPDVKFNQRFDNGGILVKQMIEKGDKCDIFVSPGTTELAALAAKGIADDTTKKPVGKYELVIITPAGNPEGITKPEDLLKLKTITCPDPNVNSVGAFGKQALMKLGLWEKLKDKFIFKEHAIDSHQLVASGKSQAGISYKNCPLETNPEKLAKSKVAIAFTFDPKDYDPAQCLVAVMKDSQVRTQSLAFIDWMLTPEAQKMLADKGLPGAGS